MYYYSILLPSRGDCLSNLYNHGVSYRWWRGKLCTHSQKKMFKLCRLFTYFEICAFCTQNTLSLVNMLHSRKGDGNYPHSFNDLFLRVYDNERGFYGPFSVTHSIHGHTEPSANWFNISFWECRWQFCHHSQNWESALVREEPSIFF